MKGRVCDLTGQRFGRLVAIERAETQRKLTRWVCVCDCGGQKVAMTKTLRRGDTQSCGCASANARRAASKSAPGSPSDPLFGTWRSMIRRCTVPTHKGWPNYGGRGISVCEEWASSFDRFAHDMGPRPPGKTLDRIDVNGNYEPGNCRWATASEQEKNKRIGPHGLPGNPARGERQGFAKLTAAQVRRIRAQRAAGMTYRRIADLHGVAVPTVQDIVAGRTWRLVA